MLSRVFLAAIAALTPVIFALAAPGDYFGIEVVDEETGRGVPLVELQTTSCATYYTDSSGLVAFHEPGLMNQKVWFSVTAHGYEFAPDGFGMRGVALDTTPGTVKQLKIKRLNIAQRLYRLTGQGIYRDTVLLGRSAPIKEPLLNGQVTGQDSILNTIYRGKLYWFYGDTSRLSYGLGNFAMSGATSDSPDKLNPEVGIDLHYFTGSDGFVRAMSPIQGEGVVWLSCPVALADSSGLERMAAWFDRRRGLGAVLENGFVIYNDSLDQFEKTKTCPLNPAIIPQGQPFRVEGDSTNLYFMAAYPALRVRASLEAYMDTTVYEGFTCLKAGTRFQSKDRAELERDSEGKLVWNWKRDTLPLNPKEQEELIKSGRMKREESPFRLADVESGKPITLHGGSCFWNAYRKRYVMIFGEFMGATVLGEIWYAEADRAEGPWTSARKIITHANKKDDAHDFYNVTQHPFLDREGGRVIYLEGTYVNTFSGNPHTTPYYEYNQILYRLDLADARLKVVTQRNGNR